MLQFAKPEFQERDRRSGKSRFLRWNAAGESPGKAREIGKELVSCRTGENRRIASNGVCGNGIGSFSKRADGRFVARTSQRQPDSRVLGCMGRLGPRWNGFIHLRPRDGSRIARIATTIRNP